MGVHSEPIVLTVGGIQGLIDLLREEGWTVVGPTVREGVIVHDEIASVHDLPAGIGDEQSPGRYRLRRRGDDALFGQAVPASSWKRLLFPPKVLILGDDGAEETPAGPVALFGVRSCDLHAIAIHDRVLLGRSVVDVRYAQRRAGAFVVAVTCADPGGTCFCAGFGTGPQPPAGSGYDVRLTELLAGGHRFVAVAGSPRGAALLARLPGTPATPADLEAEASAVQAAAASMFRTLPTDGLRDDLYAAAEHPHWEDVAARCLACANCTLVCPTCFCTSMEDTGDLAGVHPRRWRVWDSCFTGAFSYLHGGSVRESTSARYRQWVTHKLAAWTDQFGGIGCVGCGRCTTWCPAGIDLLTEVAAVRGPGPARAVTKPTTEPAMEPATEPATEPEEA